VTRRHLDAHRTAPAIRSRRPSPPRRPSPRRLWAGLLLLGLASLTACQGDPTGIVTTWDATPPPPEMPTYAELAERYNQRLASLDQLWARATVAVDYLDEDGQRQRDVAEDSKVIIELPDRVAVIFGKLGNTFFWAGSNETHYWLFDLRDDRRVYFGRHGGPGQVRQPGLLASLRPGALPRALGLTPLDPDNPPAPPAVEWFWGAYVVEPPGFDGRLVVDPGTFAPRKIHMTGRDGYSRIVATLNELESVDVRSGSPPVIPQDIRLAILGEPDRMRVELRDATDGRRRGRIQPAQFDLDHLMTAFEPAEVIDLDEPTPPSATQASP